MKNNTTAYNILWPTDPDLILRCVHFYVGQGSSTLILAADGAGSYKTMLIDINLDAEREGVNVPQILTDLLGVGGRLDCFVNTHPHSDHLNGIIAINEGLNIREIWHSGHNPGREHDAAYQDLKKVIKAVEKKGGTVVELLGSHVAQPFGEASYYVLAPAEYVKDDIQGEDAETRSRRIHEHCAVLRFGYKGAWILVTGDADRDAWEKHITDYHGKGDENRIAAAIMAAPHHGSRSFFHYQEDDDPYTDAIELIAPKYVIISAPTQKESPHGHPHTDALKIYREYVKTENLLHTGEKRYCYICDIYNDGQYSVCDDKGHLVKDYPINSRSSENNNSGNTKESVFLVPSAMDRRPMGDK